MKILFIDIGYGDAILIELPDGEKVLIDAGSAQHAGRLVKYLTDHKIKNIQTAVVTHPHENHFGGFLSLVKECVIGKFYVNGDDQRAERGYDGLIKEITRKQIPVAALKEGDELVLAGGEVRFLVLHPSALEGEINENAVVFWVTFNETSFLLTSDIQQPQQEAILARYPQVKSADIIQVPHHGGRISDRFAESFRDDALLIVSTGTNEYGKPFVEELDKLKGKVLRTDLHGSIVLKSDGRHVRVVNEPY